MQPVVALVTLGAELNDFMSPNFRITLLYMDRHEREGTYSGD